MPTAALPVSIATHAYGAMNEAVSAVEPQPVPLSAVFQVSPLQVGDGRGPSPQNSLFGIGALATRWSDGDVNASAVKSVLKMSGGTR